VDGIRFDALTRALSLQPTRRGLAVGVVGAALGLMNSRLGGTVDARQRQKGKKPRKPKRNAYGCLDVGKPCRGKDRLCCSGVCKGQKPEKGKKDTSRCVAHDVRNCSPQRELCHTGIPLQSLCSSPSIDAVCFRTTGNASFCGIAAGFSGEANCRKCRKDTDCEKLGFPKGSACVVIAGGKCVDEATCAGVNDSEGTACVAPLP
jgi:hypothetical protein